MKPRVDYTLYLCTDRELMSAERLEKAVELAIQGGVTVVQLREKDCTGREFLQIAKDVKQITDAYEIPLIINDRIDIAMAVDADGVHLGQSDIPAHTARELLGPDKIIGVSAYNKELAVEAQKEGADYLGVGDVFGTSTKAGTHHVEIDILREICNAVKIDRRCQPIQCGKTGRHRCQWGSSHFGDHCFEKYNRSSDKYVIAASKRSYRKFSKSITGTRRLPVPRPSSISGLLAP